VARIEVLTSVDLDVDSPLFVERVEIAAASRGIATNYLASRLGQAVSLAQPTEIDLRE
jgi:hypothetical protein